MIVTGLTAARMEAIEAASVVDGHVDGSGHLILEKFDASTIDAGNVIGPTGAPGVTDVEFDAAMDSQVKIGFITEYIGSTAPNANWLTMTGQTIVNGQSLYPGLWAVIPASMKSGSNIVMPNTKGKVSVGLDTGDTDFDTIGETGGSKTHTLTQAQLPAAPVTVNPPSTPVKIPASGQAGVAATGVTVGAATFGITSSSSTDFVVDIAQFDSGNMGSGQSHPIVQPYVVFLKIIKAL